MRELVEKDWLTLFDMGVISVITTYQIHPIDGCGPYWFPESFRQHCPPEIKARILQKYLELKKIGYNEIEIGKRLYKLPYVKKYIIPNNQ
jgi:hypothetical protein